MSPTTSALRWTQVGSDGILSNGGICNTSSIKDNAAVPESKPTARENILCGFDFTFGCGT
jgi:hypothetical protein